VLRTGRDLEVGDVIGVDMDADAAAVTLYLLVVSAPTHCTHRQYARASRRAGAAATPSPSATRGISERRRRV
jgi:hypothetical protein